ncbi:hypothetical protein [Chryseobacterium sp. SORGH_AS_1175]|uniref:hypothetical protein n=1 Tax=Chryseobacterium sp. SORGH_AS_1175 TaxID=3041760 RepID=UPI0028634B67|nr:hypothetical protein [Chryseobacterium sp. SORGH_AS_1175]MDR6129329.1 hypothetical protein [Chryseobacterium sp. SORGH_AS_1175]
MKTMLKSILTAALLLSAVSCNTNEMSDLNSSAKTEISNSGNHAAKATDDPENPLNNWEECGKKHNVILTYVINYEKTLENSGLTNSEIADKCIMASNNYFNQKYAQDYNNIQSPFTVDKIRSILNDGDNKFTNVIQSLSTSDKVKEKSSELINMMYNLASTDKDTEYADVKASIVDFENSIMNDASLNQGRKRSAAKNNFYSTLFFLLVVQYDRQGRLSIFRYREKEMVEMAGCSCL